jgi:hypothetical protein
MQQYSVVAQRPYHMKFNLQQLAASVVSRKRKQTTSKPIQLNTGIADATSSVGDESPAKPRHPLQP